MMQIVMRLFPYTMGKNSLSKKNIYVYAITNHQNNCIFFSIFIRFFRHTSWSHETGIISKELRFFYSKQSFNIGNFLHKTIIKFKFTNTSNVNGLKQKDNLFFAGLNPFHVPFHATIELFHACFPRSTKENRKISQNSR